MEARERINLKTKDVSCLEEVIDNLSQLKDNLQSLVGSNDNELAKETIELLKEFKAYFISPLKIPVTDFMLFKNIDELNQDFQLTFSYWVSDEDGNSGLITKRIDELNN